MIGFTHRFSRHSFVLAIGACLMATLSGTDWTALAQDQSAATPQDAIVARKMLMSYISDTTDLLEKMTITGKIDLAVGNKQAEQISVMLGAFPHLFPASTNQWKPNTDPDPITGTIASPDVWLKFTDFYQRAANASQTANQLSRTVKEADFKTSVLELRAACDSCHALYMKQ